VAVSKVLWLHVQGKLPFEGLALLLVEARHPETPTKFLVIVVVGKNILVIVCAKQAAEGFALLLVEAAGPEELATFVNKLQVRCGGFKVFLWLFCARQAAV
jgi:hypothetical protein